jgi:hypothetical protein
VQVDVEREILAPGVEDGQDPGLGAEMTRIAGEFEQGIGRGSEE